MSERKTIKIENENLISKIEGRMSIAMDTSVWFNLAEYDNEQVKRVKKLLINLVDEEKIFCPLTFSSLSELLKRSYSNAILIAELMDQLSLGISFVQNNEIYYREIEMFLLSSIKNQEYVVEKKQLFAPVIGWLGTMLNVDFPQGFSASSEKLKEFITQATNEINSLTVTGLVSLLKTKVPVSGGLIQPNYNWKKNWEENRGNKNRLKQIEKQSVFQKIIDEIIKETDSVNPMDSFIFKMNVLRYIDSLPKDEDGTSADAIFERMPAHRNMSEVMAFAGFDPQRSDKINDFYDLEFLIIPMAYADVAVATDKWIRNLMKSYKEELHPKSARYFGTWDEFENYLKQM